MMPPLPLFGCYPVTKSLDLKILRRRFSAVAYDLKLDLLGRSPLSRCFRGGGSGLPSHVEPIGFFGGAAEQGSLLFGGMPGGDALKRIPQHLIAAGALIDREIALKHRTLRSEGGDAGLDIGPPGLLQILRGRRLGFFKEIEADHLHAETAELDISVGEARDLLDLGAPSGEGFVALARIGTDRDRSADVMQHDPRLREGTRQIDDVAELGLEDPSVESQIQRDQRRKAFSEVLVQVQSRPGAPAEALEHRILAPGRSVAKAADAAVGDGDVSLEHALGARSEAQIDIADDSGDATCRPVIARGTHRRNPADELGLAKRFQFLRPIGSVHGADLLLQHRPELLARPNIFRKVDQEDGVATPVLHRTPQCEHLYTRSPDSSAPFT